MQEYTKVKEWHYVTPEILQKEIIPAYEPAVLKNAFPHWKILKSAQESDRSLFKYLKKRCKADAPVSTFIAKPEIKQRYFYNDNLDGFNFDRQKETFVKALDRIQINSMLKEQFAYIGATDVKTHMQNFPEENPLNLLDKGVNYQTRIWIGNSATVSTHFDIQDNIAGLVSGEREFMLFPPEQIKNLYVGPLNNTIAGPPTSLVNIDQPDFEKHPRYKVALERAFFAKLSPGDAIFIPSLWWHNVRSSGKICVLVNHWWNNPKYKVDNTMTAMLHSLYTISHLPQKERMAWRALFDYFIFQTDGDPLKHIPEQQRGVLAKMTPRLYRTIKTYVLKAMMPRR